MTINPAARPLLNTVLGLINQKNWTNALLGCTLLISSGNVNAIIFFLAGLCHWKTGKKDAGAGFFHKALELDQTFPQAHFAHYALGQACQSQWVKNGSLPGERRILKEAAKHYDTAIVLNKSGGNGTYLYALADCLSLLGYLDKAVHVYNLAFAQSHNPEGCLYNKGVCLYSLKQYEQALQAFEALLELNPEHEQAVTWMAKLKLKLKAQNFEQSLPALAATIERVIPNLRDLAELAVPGGRIYAVSPNRDAELLEDDCIEFAFKALAQAHGLAALCYAWLKDWAKTGASIKRSLSYNLRNRAAHEALALCEQAGGEGALMAREIRGKQFGFRVTDDARSIHSGADGFPLGTLSGSSSGSGGWASPVGV